ncbi:DUF421 domain-containing protein [Roseomonas sp. CECT 9278]|uniref:DUF421 domain-containing protein n=1 Tax=Roseomonas sp. CECT 9278 TaxID=2845823 RepID=UPI001E3BB121|nr:YetF domain-containing protein [Roseomonas sp. CECT 9278]CAH0198527.1 hypothetical protein ROS9278_01864 [Roseomonas sp. CECT 9278]
MDTVLRAAAVYLVLLLLFRIAGRRSLYQITTFDLVLLLVIGEATQPALLGDDLSVTTAVIAITTLLTLDIVFSLVKRDVPVADRVLDGRPTLLVLRGQPLDREMRMARIDLADILQAARERQGIVRIEDIGMAVLEVGGAISVIPRGHLDAAIRA